MKEFKIFFTLILVLTINITSAQLCTEDNRFTNSEYFFNSQIDSLKNVTFAKSMDHKGDAIDLKMDIYFPNNDIDTMVKRPFILLIHGGGWNSGSREDYTYQSKKLAKRGFVTATMSYRLGFGESTEEFLKAIYRSQQDALSALNYITEDADKLKIDISWVFLGGTSAGGIASLLTTYADQEEWGMRSKEIESALGPLESPDNPVKHPYVIKGIYNHMGSVLPHVLDAEDLIPTISFHGALDKAIPIGISKGGHGSSAIHDALNKASVCNDITTVLNRGHDIYLSQKGQDFRIERVASFFSSLFCDTCTSSNASEDVFTKG